MPRTVLITGATGTVGSALVRALAAAGVRPRAFARDADRARARLGDAADVVVGDLADAPALRSALTGVEALFLACGNVPGQVALECAAVDAARSAGVRRVVKLSARGAARTATAAVWRGHAEIEEHLAASGLPAVVLRPSFFLSNLLAAAGPVRDSGILPAPAGTAPIAMVDPADVAAVAARALLDDAVAPGVLPLTGPEALTYGQVAARLTEVLGRGVTHVDVPADAAARGMVAGGMPEAAAQQVLEVFAGLRRGEYATADDIAPGLTGRPSGTLTGFVRDHAAVFGALVSR